MEQQISMSEKQHRNAPERRKNVIVTGSNDSLSTVTLIKYIIVLFLYYWHSSWGGTVSGSLMPRDLLALVLPVCQALSVHTDW